VYDMPRVSMYSNDPLPTSTRSNSPTQKSPPLKSCRPKNPPWRCFGWLLGSEPLMVRPRVVPLPSPRTLPPPPPPPRLFALLRWPRVEPPPPRLLGRRAPPELPSPMPLSPPPSMPLRRFELPV
jgi:hypothetical protein